MSKRSNHITNVNKKSKNKQISVVLGTKNTVRSAKFFYLIVSSENSTKGFCLCVIPGI